MGNSKREIKEKVIHGTYGEDEFLLVKEGDELLIVHDHYFHYSSDILFSRSVIRTQICRMMTW